MKFNLHKLEKTALIGVASLALIIPLAGNGAPVQASSHHSLRYYEKCMDDDDTLDDSSFDNNSDDSLTTVRMKLLMKHPALKHTIYSKELFDGASDGGWEDDDWSFYAHHYKQLYSPYLRKAMPSHEPTIYYHARYNTYLIHKAQRQMGLFGHHRGKRIHHIKRHRVNHHKHTRRHAKRNVRRRNHRSYRKRR